MPSKMPHGKICYIEIPTTDVAHSADFYKKMFGWNIRKRGDGSTSFDDTTNEVSGAFVLGRPPSGQPGLLMYISWTALRLQWTWWSPTAAKSYSLSAPMLPKSPHASAIRAATSSGSTSIRPELSSTGNPPGVSLPGTSNS